MFAVAKVSPEIVDLGAILDCSPTTFVRLDRSGRITYVNEAWRSFARDNGADVATIVGVGLDYLSALRTSAEESARLVADGLAHLLAGRQQSLTCIYPCHSPTEVRWFKLDAMSIGREALVVQHTNITPQLLAERRLSLQSVVAQAFAERASLVETCRRIIRAVCERLEWHVGRVWTRGADGRLRCIETWKTSGTEAAELDPATQSGAFESGLPGRVWAEGVPEWVRQVATDASSPREMSEIGGGFRSGFAVPFVAGGEVFAVLEFFSRIRRERDAELLELLATTGAQLGAQLLLERADQRAALASAVQQVTRRTLDAIVDCAPAGIVAIDAQGKVQFINRVLAHRKKEDAIGSDWLEYVPPEKHAGQRARLRAILDTGTPQIYETMVACGDGETRWFSTHMGPMREGDRIVGAVLVSQEVSELKRAHAEVAAAQRLASVGTLAAGVAHEINTPIQFINDSVHFLRDATQDVFVLVERLQEVRRVAREGAPPGELASAVAAAAEAEGVADLGYLRENVPSAFARCINGLERVSNIVRSMKEFSQPAQKEMAPIDLNRAIQNTLTIARAEYGAVAELETDFGELRPVTCHVNDVNVVMLNLVMNAAHAVARVVKGTAERGTIKVSTREDGEHVVVSIRDTGVGIAEAIGARVFEPFFTTKEVGEGTGQGLAIAWDVVKNKHGGELSFESKPGVGTTFFIRLPIQGKDRPGCARDSRNVSVSADDLAQWPLGRRASPGR